MEHLEKALANCPLFKDIPVEEVGDVLQKTDYRVLSFSKNQIVALEGESCAGVGIIIKGSIEIKKILASGKSVVITRMNTGNIFGEVMAFTDNNSYPSTIISSSDTKIVSISRDDIISLCSSNTRFLNNVLGLLSNKILTLNEKIKSLSYQSIRQKISAYIIDEYNKQHNLTLNLPCSRKELAELLGVPRPSLSREMKNMKNDGLMDFSKNTVRIIDLNSLEDSLLK
ncbi:MAG: Crp/Fnr family transcriptional regulator [Bacillota bacterium]